MKLSVLMATFNRAEMLRRTLDAMCDVDRNNLDVEFVIVDNGSTDHTGDVIRSFDSRLPIRHLFESGRGKSAALNLALDTGQLGEIVVFTDDDVRPRRDWLKQIERTCDRRSDIGIFGGRIRTIWPDDQAIPRWVNDKRMEWLFSAHEHGTGDRPYENGLLPSGANTFMKSELCAEHRFDESLGPGKAFGTGEDIRYIDELMRKGHEALYIGAVEVGHQIEPLQLTEKDVTRRAFRYGRGIAYRTPLPRESLYQRHPNLWLTLRLISIARHGISAFVLSVPIPSDTRFLLRIRALMDLGINVGQFALAAHKRQQTADTLD